MRRLILALLFALLPATADAQLILYGRNPYPLLCDGTNCTLQSGQLRLPDGTAAAPSSSYTNDTDTGRYRLSSGVESFASNGVRSVSTGLGYVQVEGGTEQYLLLGSTGYLILDAANTLAQRNGTAAQTLRVYGTFTDASNYERVSLSHDGANGILETQVAGTGVVDDFIIRAGGAVALRFGTNGSLRWQVMSTGHFLAEADNSYDIGASGATRPRTVYAGTSINAAGATAFVASGANAQAANIKQITELHTLAAASTSDTTITFPANVLILGVSWRVTTEITGPTSFNIGDQDTPALYATGVALAAGTTGSSAGTTSAKIPGGVRAIRFTGVGGGVSFTAGVIRVTGYYIDLTAPTS